MIELRWVDRQVPRKRGIDDGMYWPPLPDTVTVRVLQYRKPLVTAKDSHGEQVLTWGEWKDVPTVEEE